MNAQADKKNKKKNKKVGKLDCQILKLQLILDLNKFVINNGNLIYPMCYYSGSTCAAYDVSKCSTRQIKEICNSGCMWVNDACVAETCASITDLTQCTSVFNDNFSEITVCVVSGQTCVDAVDAKALTSSSCYKNTIGYFFWDGSVCSPCTGNYEISKSNLLALFGTLVLLFI